MTRLDSTARQRWWQAGVGLVVVCVLTYALTRLSLDNVPGVTERTTGPVGERCCDTTFVNDGWWYAMLMLCVPIWWLTRTVEWVAALAAVVPTYATFHVANTVVDRYARSGSSDGLEVFSYAISFGHAVFFVSVAASGILRRRHPRNPGGPQAPSNLEA